MDNYVSSQIDGLPVLVVKKGSIGCHLALRDSQDRASAPGVDFYAPNIDAERLRRAADAFNREMQREPVAQQQAAE